MKWIPLRFKHRYYCYRLRRKNLPAVIRDYLQAFRYVVLETPIAETEFVVFDTETTGLDVKQGDRILSISAVRLKNGRIDLSDIFHEMIDPERDIPSDTAVIHEIVPRMVDGKPPLAELLPDFISYVGSAVMVGHHEWLDMTFLNTEMTRLFGFPLLNIVLDTATLDQAIILKKTPMHLKRSIRINSSLGALAERYRVSIEERHSSFWDALATAQIFQKMIKDLEKQGILSLKGLLKLVLTPPRLGPDS